ncbi:type II toxin-antitoxin system HicB family antitoxin [Paenibacillus elgii]|uniref:type II toxin-antitoxin system HicB family antitoxin n=1 Tax=Paenibacillus elgii TaxID=189691 RepID=UPI00203C861F|nr:type II toxin-antitoxin system HicB family antitoxin [Paenibacillus elgii]MCM3273050.1 type II toxin-antitoxin system HicB family antitoxin [Paenibacillus elgii]
MKNLSLSLIFYPQSNGGYHVTCPELQGCFSEGDTYEEAHENILDLIKEHVKSMKEDDTNDLLSSVAMPNKIYTEINLPLD